MRKADLTAASVVKVKKTFSAARWNTSGAGPPPVRSKTEIYGLATNNSGLQRQADEGTLLATRSCSVVAEIVRSQRLRKVPEAGAVENPPGTENGPDGPMWMLPEVVAFVEDLNATEALFNTFAFQSACRLKRFKPGKFVGRLERLGRLSRKCSCPSGFRHQQLVEGADRGCRGVPCRAMLRVRQAHGKGLEADAGPGVVEIAGGQ